MSVSRCFLFFALSGAILGLVACDSTGTPSVAPGAHSAYVTGGLAPPPGRTSAERQARKAYYRGPRGSEF